MCDFRNRPSFVFCVRKTQLTFAISVNHLKVSIIYPCNLHSLWPNNSNLDYISQVLSGNPTIDFVVLRRTFSSNVMSLRNMLCKAIGDCVKVIVVTIRLLDLAMGLLV